MIAAAAAWGQTGSGGCEDKQGSRDMGVASEIRAQVEPTTFCVTHAATSAHKPALTQLGFSRTCADGPTQALGLSQSNQPIRNGSSVPRPAATPATVEALPGGVIEELHGGGGGCGGTGGGPGGGWRGGGGSVGSCSNSSSRAEASRGLGRSVDG